MIAPAEAGSGAAGGEWLTLFSGRHAAVAGLLSAWIVLILVLGRWMKRRGDEAVFRRALGIVAVMIAVVYNAYWLTPPRLVAATSLPLHICDITLVLAPVSLLLDRRWTKALMYFWGFGLSTQGFITPVERAGPSEPAFWVFWIAHTQIVGTGLYHPVVAGYRPGRRDLATAVGVGLVVIAGLFAFDAVTGFNYGYVGPTEPPPGIVAKLGPYPLRAALVVALAVAVMIAAQVPWELARRGRRATAASRRP